MLQNVAEYEALIEKSEVLQDINTAERQLEEGKGRCHEEAKRPGIGKVQPVSPSWSPLATKGGFRVENAEDQRDSKRHRDQGRENEQGGADQGHSKAEGNAECFAVKNVNGCDQLNCLWREDCGAVIAE